MNFEDVRNPLPNKHRIDWYQFDADHVRDLDNFALCEQGIALVVDVNVWICVLGKRKGKSVTYLRPCH